MSKVAMAQQDRYLFLFDFDGTLADTFSPSPNNIGVNEAYEGAIVEVFGKRGLDVYEEIGGLKNNAPSELVGRILQHDTSLSKYAKSKYFSGRPKGFDWNECDINQAITEFLIEEKLKISLKEIGPDWPKPFDGVIQMLLRIKELNKTGTNLDVGIVTSGHTEFVEKVLRTWGVEGSNVCITDDDLRYKYPVYPKPEGDRLIKPSSTLFAIVRAKWLRRHGIEPVDTDTDFVLGMREHVVYFGDDIVKDGEFAANSGLLFGHFNIEGKDLEFKDDSFSFPDWSQLNKFILSDKAVRRMQEGKNIKEVFAEVLKEREKPEEQEVKIKMQ